MLFEIESIMAVPPRPTQIYNIVKVAGGNGQPIQGSESSIVLYLCLRLLALFVLELHHL